MSEREKMKAEVSRTVCKDDERSSQRESANEVGQASGNFADESNVEAHPELREDRKSSDNIIGQSEEAESDRSPSGEQ
jgi:hypothetical protein